MPDEAAKLESKSRFRPGLTLAGKFQLLQLIAVGGMGEIWAARNETTEAYVALKIRRADGDANTQTEARFRHEARLSAMLAHRNIVRVFDLVRDGEDTWILVMELLRGESLEHHLAKRGPLSPQEALSVIVPILSALAHAHEMGIIHRDMTTGNIFLAVDPDGHVIPKLVDFGIARLPTKALTSDVQTLEGHVLGTPRYMSPEHIRGGAEIDERSDLFGAALVLYEMMTLVAPFAATTPAASLAAVLEVPVDPHPKIPPRLWLEVQRSLNKRPYERHANAKEFSQAICSSLDTTIPEVAPPFVWSKPPPPLPAFPKEDSHSFAGVSSFDGQSLAFFSSTRRGTRLFWIVASLLGIGIVAFGLYSIQTAHVSKLRVNAMSVPSVESPTAVPAPMSVPSSPAMTPVPNPTGSTSSAAALPIVKRSSGVPTGSVTETGTASPRPVTRSRTIATTPGF